MKTELIGVSRSIKQIRKLIERVADSNLNVIITGETGVGKGIVARQLHEKSNRVGQPFVKVNCAALPEPGLGREMFCYEQENFSGAHRILLRKLVQADKGVLFLDKIDNMAVSLLNKVLPALQNGDFTNLDTKMSLISEAWIIASTSQDLENTQWGGRFKEGLVSRPATISIHIDPLRRRPEDIPHLINYYSKKYNKQLLKTKTYSLTASTVEALVKYRWPGNVRQLQNALKRLILFGETKEILTEITT